MKIIEYFLPRIVELDNEDDVKALISLLRQHNFVSINDISFKTPGPKKCKIIYDMSILVATICLCDKK